MELNEFEKLCENIFTEIFNSAKKVDEKRFLTNCFTFHNKWNHNILTYSSDREFQEVLELINDISGLKDSESIKNTTKTRMYLLIYSHIVEADLIYMILYNMINTIRKKEYSPVVKYLNKKGEEMDAEYPSQKVKSLQDIGFELDIDIEKLYSSFFDKNLRNAFSHSQYYLDSSGSLENTKNRTMYIYEDIKGLFEMSLAYVKSFIDRYQKSIKPYMDGKSHETLFGSIKFDSEHGWGFTQK